MITITQLKEDPRFGSIAELARVCNVSKQAASKWTRLPAEHCITVERETEGRFTRYQLRPDVFGPAPDPSAAKAA